MEGLRYGSQFFSCFLFVFAGVYLLWGSLWCGFVPLKIEFHCLCHAFFPTAEHNSLYLSSVLRAARWNYIIVLWLHAPSLFCDSFELQKQK
jgi:hypothetical protein